MLRRSEPFLDGADENLVPTGAESFCARIHASEEAGREANAGRHGDDYFVVIHDGISRDF
jgi:hypothetical protein